MEPRLSPPSCNPILLPPPAPPLARLLLNDSFRQAEINPSIVVIVIILTIIFFLSGCLHLLIRCLVIRHHHHHHHSHHHPGSRRDPNASLVSITALQGQLQQLFHLHDSGVEQSFIDTLPVFLYNSVQKGLKEGADCAVCLCEFEGEDRLRLLPKCSHAFHMDCIDTWLLSHSTCPLCRRSLFPEQYIDLSSNNGVSSGTNNFISAHHGSFPLRENSSSSYTSVEALETAGGGLGFMPPSIYGSSARSSVDRIVVHDGSRGGLASVECSSPNHWDGSKRDQKEVAGSQTMPRESEYIGRVLPVQLGRFRAVVPPGGAEVVCVDTGTSSDINRRSYSVGSYEYVLDPTSLEVLIAATPYSKRRAGPTPRRQTPATPGHRATLSECSPEDTLGPGPMLTPLNPRLFPPTPLGAPHPHKGYAHINLDMSPIHPHPHHHWHSPMAGARPKPCDPLPLALCYCTGDHTQKARRAFSFRHPLDAEAVRLKMSTSRRSHSDIAESFPGNVNWRNGGGAAENGARDSFSGAQLMNMNASGDLSHTSSAEPRSGGSNSLAKRTLNWLVGGKR